MREMAGDLGVSEKTIRRDLGLFRDLGFPLEEVVGEFGRKTWRIVSNRGQPPLTFSFDEAAALYLGRRALEPLAGTLLWDAAQRALQKVRASLGRSALEYLARFSVLFHTTLPGAHDYSGKADLIDRLQIAVEDGKVVEVLYRSERAAEPSYRGVHPYGLIQHRAALYLAALDPADEKVKHYKVDRIEAVRDGGETFRRPETFDLAGSLASSFGVYQSEAEEVTVRVWFAPGAARYVRESRWHGSQRLMDQDDGSLVAEFRLSGTEEFERWVLSFGARAVVLEPASLREEIKEELEDLLTVYQRQSPESGQRGAPRAEPPAAPATTPRGGRSRG